MLTKTKNSGFSIIEAMVAMVIMSISFAGIYTMAGYSSVALRNSMDRQKMQVMANEIFETIENDYNIATARIDFYNGLPPSPGAPAPGIDLTTDCNTIDATVDISIAPNIVRWCNMLVADFGPAMGGCERRIRVQTLTGDARTVTIVLESKPQIQNAQIVMKKMYDRSN